jgi:hypothetical protein
MIINYLTFLRHTTKESENKYIILMFIEKNFQTGQFLMVYKGFSYFYKIDYVKMLFYFKLQM